ncbi:MAG: acyl-CoA dehydrogenase, partial [Zoogloea sp.]|nr:acyl-CoA dehydrogenase [Zoogloea sp.]
MNWTTHQVANQVPDLLDYNLYAGDTILRESVAREGASWHAAALERYGALAGSAEALALGAEANRNRPQLASHDRQGRRVDQMSFHPAWQQLMGMLWAEGVHCSAWSTPRPGAHVARAAAFFMHGQIEAGTLCPTTMTFAAIPLLAREPALFQALRGKLLSQHYDGRDLPVADKQAMQIGMGLTETQGGSD